MSAFDELMAEADKEIAKAGGGAVKFMKTGDVLLKLVSRREDLKDLFRRYVSLYKDGSDVTNFLVQCVIVKADADGMADKTRVVFLRIPNTGFKLLKKAIQDDPEVLDSTGPCILLSRSSSTPITYSANIKSRLVWDDSTAIEPEMDIDAAVVDQIAYAEKTAKKAAPAAEKAKAPAIDENEDVFADGDEA